MAQRAGYLDFDDEFVDFAVTAYQEDGCWAAVGLPPHVAESLDGFLKAVRQQGSEGPTIGLLGVGDDYFVAVRLIGRQVRVFLSNAAAAADDRIAGEVVHWCDPQAAPEPAGDAPVGDPGIFADLGLDPLELTLACARLLTERDLELTDVVGGIAARIGFGDQFARAAKQCVAAEDWHGEGFPAAGRGERF